MTVKSKIVYAPASSKEVQVEGQGQSKTCAEALCGCCDRGGCCRQAPPKVITDEKGVIQRINLIYNPAACCGPSQGVYDVIPQELVDLGLTKDEIEEWIFDRLQKSCRQRSSHCCCSMKLIAAIVFPFILPFLCPALAREDANWDKELRNWQDEFNKQVLSKKGMFVKTQSRCDVTYDKDGKHRHIERWISIALTPEAVESLQSEPHLIGDIENWTCCNGPDENLYCMHP